MDAISGLKLSLCISTLNRETYLAQVLDGILPQLTDSCEVIILDVSPNDRTEKVVNRYAERCSQLRYVHQSTNNGLDRDYDRVVELARGEYCWFVTDDDPLKPNAINVVLEALRDELSLVLVNMEATDLDCSKVLLKSFVNYGSDRSYDSSDVDRLFAEMQGLLMLIGSVVVKRDVWITRDRAPYYGSWFIHIGVLFQRPLPGRTKFIAQPLVSHREGNPHTFSSRGGEIIFYRYPTLVRSLALSDTLKRDLTCPWKSLRSLMWLRGWGIYSSYEYYSWVEPHLKSCRDRAFRALLAMFPGYVLNALLLGYCSLHQDRFEREIIWLRESRYHFSNILRRGANAAIS